MLLLASLTDIQKWLPEDKLEVDEPSTSDFQIEARRIIKGQLSGVFQPTTLFGWDSPENTPDLIRGVAGRLIAAYVYRETYSEDDTAIPEYAQALYDEAIAILTAIRTGAMIVLDENDNPIEQNQLDMTSADFYPNDDAPGPFFTIDQVFG